MKRRREKLPKWRYEFDCRKCDNIREIHDPRKGRDGDYCIPCIERMDSRRPSPTACAYCKYYENMGGNRGRGSDGVCTARGTLYATRGIRVSKERLDNCPLRIITGGRE